MEFSLFVLGKKITKNFFKNKYLVTKRCKLYVRMEMLSSHGTMESISRQNLQRKKHMKHFVFDLSDY